MGIVWKPNKGPQSAFLACPVFEVFYGGAAGGGKSDALLIDALAQTVSPHCRALMLRRSYPELTELIGRSRELYPAAWPGARYHKTEKTWVFPNGATIRFGYVRADDDVYQYQGQAFTWVGWDELTHYSLFAYRYLMSRVRSVHIPDRVRLRATGNPGGKGHGWVKARFIDPAPPLTTITDAASGSKRVFIPSSLKDNPHLAATDYGQRLMLLGEQDRRALLEGDWSAYEGSVFTLTAGVQVWSWAQFNEVQGLPRGNRKMPSDWLRFRVMDWGYARPFAIYWIAVDYAGRAYVYREWYGVKTSGNGEIEPNVGIRMDPADVARRIRTIEGEAGEEMAAAWTGPDLWHAQRGDHAGGSTVTLADHFQAEGVYWQPWSAGPGSRVQGKQALHKRLFSEAGEQPGLVFLGEETPHAQRTIPALEPDKDNPEDVDSTGEDHGYDAIKAFCLMRSWAPEQAKQSGGWRERRQANGSTWEW